MPVYLVAQASISDIEAYKKYASVSGPLIKKYGGEILSRGANVETLEGDAYHKRLVVVRFDSAESAKAFYYSKEYQQAKQMREHCSNVQIVISEAHG